MSVVFLPKPCLLEGRWGQGVLGGDTPLAWPCPAIPNGLPETLPAREEGETTAMSLQGALWFRLRAALSSAAASCHDAEQAGRRLADLFLVRACLSLSSIYSMSY